MAGIKINISDRFWTKVDRNGPVQPHVPHLGPCWVWTAGKAKNGYGKASYSRPRRQRSVHAHRVSWELTRGPIPAGLCILHHCDNPPCVNPGHLWIGTIADNNADKARKGRQPKGALHHSHLHPECRPRGEKHWSRYKPECAARGERNGSARMTEAKVREIRRRVAEGERRQIVADEFDIAITTVSAIIRRVIWKHVP